MPTNWTTYRITGYAYQAGNDGRATGGVHLQQVRRTRAGYWQARTVDSNGRFQSAGPVISVSPEDGNAMLASSESR